MSQQESVALGVAVLTISDTRTRANDTSGDFLTSGNWHIDHSVAGVGRLCQQNRHFLHARLNGCLPHCVEWHSQGAARCNPQAL